MKSATKFRCAKTFSGIVVAMCRCWW